MKPTWSEMLAAATRIPDLGDGGRTIREDLVRLAAGVPVGGCIVEIAPWLGSATAFLAMGSPNDARVHCFDLWEAAEVWRQKAKDFHGIELEPDANLEPMWRTNVDAVLADSSVKVVGYRGDIRAATWPGTPIDLFVDDISNTEELIESTMRIFGPSIKKGALLVMMDWQFPQAEPQRAWFHAHADEYEFVKTIGPKAALLRKL